MFPWKKSAVEAERAEDEDTAVREKSPRPDEPTQVTGILQELRIKVAESEKKADDIEAKATLVIRSSKVSYG